METDSGGFKVGCTSTGGRPLTMSVTGPTGVVENIMNIIEVDNIEGLGNDTFSAEVIKQNAKHGDIYTCTALNEVSNLSSNGSVMRGLCL